MSIFNDSSIDTLKGSISRRGGLSQGNRFAIMMSNPSGQNIFNGGAGNGLANVGATMVGKLISGGTDNFKYSDLGSFVNDPRDMYLLAESCSLPGRAIITEERPVGDFGYTTAKMPYGYTTDDVTFTFLVTNDFYTVRYLNSWMDVILPQDTDGSGMRVNYKGAYSRDITIQHIGASGFVPTYSIKLIQAYPVAINSIELSNQSSDILKVTVTMTYDNWIKEDIVPSAVNSVKTHISNIF